jgi:hypothetical protein
MVGTVTGRPYKQWTISQNVFVRVFPRDTDVRELVWHRDRKDRRVTVLEGNGWLFQYDNEIPRELTDGFTFEIDKGHYHRLIKGNGELFLKIIEKNGPF